MKKFLVVIETTGTGFSAYSPDLPGCVATGGTVADTESSMYAAIRMHLEGMAEDGEAIPPSSAIGEYLVA